MQMHPLQWRILASIWRTFPYCKCNDYTGKASSRYSIRYDSLAVGEKHTTAARWDRLAILMCKVSTSTSQKIYNCQLH